MTDDASAETEGRRGPLDHHVRAEIVSAANKHFSHYGYGKTTVADLARAIGFSKAYIYKFFDSKQAIAEAICSQCLSKIDAAAREAVADGESPTDKLRRMLKAIVSSSEALFFSERKLFEIASYSESEKWRSWTEHQARVRALLKAVLLEGRASGEFERKTPIDETCRSIMYVFQPFMNPLMLQYNLDSVAEGVPEVSSLILRSLAP